MDLENKLVIIGGASCVGKSTLIRGIQNGAYPDLRKQLGITDPSSWRYVPAIKLIQSREPLIGKLVVHYDMYGLYPLKNGRNTRRAGFNYLSEFINNSDSVFILTLFASPEILVKRTNLRIYSFLKTLLSRRAYRKNSLSQLWKRSFYLLGKRKNYKENYSSLLYKKWLLFFKENNVDAHWILDCNKQKIEADDLYKIDNCDFSKDVYKLIN